MLALPAIPGLHGRGVMVDLGDRGGNAGHLFKSFGREGKIEDINGMVCQVGHVPRLAVVHRPIGGSVAEMTPGSISGTEAVQTVGVIKNANRHVSSAAAVRRAG